MGIFEPKTMHGNDKNNANLHHLYDIFVRADRDTFKFGISDDPIDNVDNLSARAREQVEEWNMAAEYLKFDAEILQKNILGRANALQIERNHIDVYFEKNGRNPFGNKYPKRK
jgi:hypothetical protein